MYTNKHHIESDSKLSHDNDMSSRRYILAQESTS